jgi:pimeloyl-ACP methyl ester carboxylesterase
LRTFGKLLGRLLLLLLIAAGALWAFAPDETVDLNAEFDARKFGEGVQVYFESTESRFSDITPGTQKRVIWAGQAETRTPYSVLYVHGFSATSEEIRPVPDRIAESLGANLVYTRLAGHGRSGAALGAARGEDWMQDTAEALAAARAVGEKVVVLSTSTGGTLTAAAAVDPDLSQDVAAMIFVSPNFGINGGGSMLLDWPGARWWVPVLLGGERSFESESDAVLTYWTHSYPWEAVVTLAGLVKTVTALDFAQARVPALFRLSLADQVVRPEETQKIAAAWGGPATVQLVELGPGDDGGAHVIAGDIVSPGQTEAAIGDMLAWLKQQGIE